MSAPPCVSLNAMKNGRPRPTLPYQGAAIYASADKQFSRPMTGHTPRKLPSKTQSPASSQCALFVIPEKSADSPYTRFIILPPFYPNVKHNFRNNHKNFLYFSFIIDNNFTPTAVTCAPLADTRGEIVDNAQRSGVDGQPFSFQQILSPR